MHRSIFRLPQGVMRPTNQGVKIVVDTFVVGVQKSCSKHLKYIEDIQMFLSSLSFISQVKWTIFIFHEWRSHE